MRITNWRITNWRITNWTRRAALGGASGLAICSPALAQSGGGTSYSIVDSPSVAQTQSHYSANATFDTEYQTNVAGGSAAVSALRGLKRDDVLFVPSVQLDAFRPIGRESVFLTGSVGYNFYDHNTSLNRESIDLNGGVNGQLSICRATVTGGYVRRQNELQDVTRTRVQDVYDQASVGMNGTCGRGYGFSPTFSVSQTWSSNSLSQLQSSDYNTLSGSAGLAYQAPTFGNLSFFGQYQSTDFTNRFLMVNLTPVQDGFDTYGGGVRYTRQLGARIQGTASLSYTSVKPFVGSGGFDGVTYGADATFRASSRLMLHGSVTRDVQPSNVFDSTYYLETKGLLEVDYKAGSRLDLNLGASELDRTFKGAALVSTIDLKNDTLKSVYAKITYSLQKVYFALNLRNDQRTANVVGLSYPDTRVGLTVGTKF